jgi:hypothetical protein
VETLEAVEEVGGCELCGKSGEDLSLYSAQHKELGWIKVCRECWVKLYDANSMVAGSGGSSGSSCPSCGL